MGTITILFVDQVGSTLQLSTLGDNSAVEILEQVQAEVTAHLERYHGTFNNHTGDGFMASFPELLRRCRLRAVPAGRDVDVQYWTAVRATCRAPDGASHR